MATTFTEADMEVIQHTVPILHMGVILAMAMVEVSKAIQVMAMAMVEVTEAIQVMAMVVFSKKL